MIGVMKGRIGKMEEDCCGGKERQVCGKWTGMAWQEDMYVWMS